MPCINRNFIDYCKSKYPQYSFNTFVETGTWKGETIFNMEPLFDNLYTIEIKKELYDNLVNNYTNNKINFINNDSSHEIPNLCKNILKDNTIFFLDGHWSRMDTGKGEKEVPLIEELTAINKYFTEAAIIIVDDIRLFGKGPQYNDDRYSDVDWSYINIKDVIDSIKDRIIDRYYLPSECAKEDRLILNIRKQNLLEQNLKDL